MAPLIRLLAAPAGVALMLAVGANAVETRHLSSKGGTSPMRAAITVEVHRISANGIGERIGTIEVQAADHGATLYPDLSGLAPGPHAFHVHTNPRCGAVETDDGMVAGLAAGGHFDPTGGGHGTKAAGDLRALHADAEGRATNPVEVHTLSVSQMFGRAIMIHAGPETPTDASQPMGGGARIACGVIGALLQG